MHKNAYHAELEKRIIAIIDSDLYWVYDNSTLTFTVGDKTYELYAQDEGLTRRVVMRDRGRSGGMAGQLETENVAVYDRIKLAIATRKANILSSMVGDIEALIERAKETVE